MYSLFRLLTVGNPTPKQMAIRGIAVVVLVVVLVVWGINYRSSLPPSGIRGDTSPTLSPLTDAGMVEVGGSVTGSLAEGERHTWQFEGAAGQRVNLRIRGDWDSTIQLIPPGGSESIAIDFNSGGGLQALLCNYRLRTAGTYRAVVSSGTSTAFGDYTLSVEEETYIEERPIAYGDTVEGQLTTCDGDFYTINVEQGDQLLVTLIPDEGAEMYTRLLLERSAETGLFYSQPVENDEGVIEELIAVDIRENATVFIHVAVPAGDPEAAYTLKVGRYEGIADEATTEPTAEATASS